MFTMIAAFIFAANVNASAPKSSCEWVGPRIDGISVLICDGSVKAMRDSSGYVLSMSEGK
jgi:hypothetical protein